jgi:biotin carboxyl carrier protein
VALWSGLVGSVSACVLVAAGCWWQTSYVEWFASLGALAILMVVTLVYDRPGRHLTRLRIDRWYAACGLAGLLSVIRVGARGWAHVDSLTMGATVCTGVVLAFVLLGLREPGRGPVDPPLALPFAAGRWRVVSGGVTALNHHVTVPAQTAGIDLVAIRADGTRACGVSPSGLDAFESYGQDVLSPCPGVVVEVVEGEPDQPPHVVPRGIHAGNVVRIATGGFVVHLSHLRQGSVKVQVGDEVAAGQPIGQVGNSGHSTEPHLHVHVERAGHGVQLRFTDRPSRRPRQGLTLMVDDRG